MNKYVSPRKLSKMIISSIKSEDEKKLRFLHMILEDYTPRGFYIIGTFDDHTMI